MHAFDVLGDPVRRRILELLVDGERSSGAVTAAIREEFGISQPAVSQHLRVLRESGFATARADGARRLYAVQQQPLQEVDQWLERFRRFWTPHLGASRPNPRVDAASNDSMGRRQTNPTEPAEAARTAAQRTTAFQLGEPAEGSTPTVVSSERSRVRACGPGSPAGSR